MQFADRHSERSEESIRLYRNPINNTNQIRPRLNISDSMLNHPRMQPLEEGARQRRRIDVRRSRTPRKGQHCTTVRAKWQKQNPSAPYIKRRSVKNGAASSCLLPLEEGARRADDSPLEKFPLKCHKRYLVRTPRNRPNCLQPLLTDHCSLITKRKQKAPEPTNPECF